MARLRLRGGPGRRSGSGLLVGGVGGCGLVVREVVVGVPPISLELSPEGSV